MWRRLLLWVFVAIVGCGEPPSVPPTAEQQAQSFCGGCPGGGTCVQTLAGAFACLRECENTPTSRCGAAQPCCAPARGRALDDGGLMYQEVPSFDQGQFGVCLPRTVGRACDPGASAPPETTTTPDLVGQYAGSFRATRTSDRPPMEGVAEQEPAYGIEITRGSTADFVLTVDTGCALNAMRSASGATIVAGQRCTSQTLMRGADFTVSSGDATLTGTQLVVRLTFRYARSGGTDTGSFAWEYTGTRR